MSDLISRQALKERLMYMARLRTNSEIGEPTCGLTRRTVFHMSEIMKVVIDMPTIEERKTGKWNTDKESPEYATCSVCGHCDWDCTESKYFNYCPNCGADMRGDDHEND